MNIIFELIVTSVGSWNNKFTGANNKYTILRKILKYQTKDNKYINNIYNTLKNKEKLFFNYSFGDGWSVKIIVRRPNQKEKPTNAFMGYEWMVDSIFKNGKIIDED